MQFGMSLCVSAVAALALSASLANAKDAEQTPRVGDAVEITLTRHSVQQSNKGSSGSSKDKETLLERVTGLRPDGIEVMYDLPEKATASERARAWQFPARVFKPFSGPPQLLNRPELEARLDGWLKAANLSRDACGRWVFTWTALRIECDPLSISATVQAYDFGSTSLRDGDLYRDTDAASAVKLALRSGESGGRSLVADMVVDPEAFRRARAESDVVVGEIMQEKVTYEAALRKRAAETIAGTITVTVDPEAIGGVRRRTKLTKLTIQSPDGLLETQTITETLERRLITQPH